MLFRWLRQRRRQQILRQPLPASWQAALEDRFALYHYLGDQERTRLHDDARILVAEKHWEGCAGMELTDENKFLIAAQAGYLLLGLEHNYYERTPTVLVYPDDFRALDVPEPDGLVEEASDRSGEAHYRGPVILSWGEALWTGEHPEQGRNLIFHEFAHQLDMLDGEANGTPPLRDRGLERRWRKVMTAEYAALRRAAELERSTLLDPYGATNEAEFFAVSTECFFTQARALRSEHQQLYRLLGDYYRQDPAERG